MPVGEAEQLLAETDRERQDFYAAPAGNQEMAELVEEHHDRQHDQEGKAVAHQTGA